VQPLVPHPARIEQSIPAQCGSGPRSNGFAPGLQGHRLREAPQKKHDQKKKARRWIVDACHGWFNRLRKRLVRYETLEQSFLALNHLAAAIIAPRKIWLPIHNIYG
jgi:hypothetical protein